MSQKSDFQLSEGVEVEELSGELYEKFCSQMKSFALGFIKLQPYNQMLPRCFLQYQKQIKEFQSRPDDVWVASFPKCGTTWTQEMVWCIMNNYDYEAGQKATLDEKFPYFEISAVTEVDGVLAENSMELVENMESPRLIKTHLSFDMLPTSITKNKAKLIYVTRNPRDTCISFYNFIRVVEGYSGTLEDFTQCFLNDMTGYYSPFIHHVLSYWKVKHEDHILFVTYEEMKSDLPSVAKKVAGFLGKELPSSPLGMKNFMDHLSFDKMKTNVAVNKDDFMQVCKEALKLEQKEDVKFMRQGKTGGWKNQFSEETIKAFEEWEKQRLEDQEASKGGESLQFTYQL